MAEDRQRPSTSDSDGLHNRTRDTRQTRPRGLPLAQPNLLHELVPATDRAPARSRVPAHGRAPQAPRERRSLGPTIAGLAAVAVVVLVTSVTVADRWTPPSDGDPGSASLEPTAGATGNDDSTEVLAPVRAAAKPVPKNTKVKAGVFRETSLSEVRAFERWAGHDVHYVIDYGARDTWRDIADPQYMLDEWKGSGYLPVYALPMLPSRQEASIEEGADGAYDRYFREFGRRLVASGQKKAILRVGWEFNIANSRWKSEDPHEFIRYWRRIVKTMRDVPGERFQFDWNPNSGETLFDGSLYYPGNDVVDYIGIDVYDVSWAEGTYPYPRTCAAACRLERQEAAWEERLYGDRGLAFWSSFAQSKKKPMSVPEWGLWKRTDDHGGNDNPYFIRQMHAFITNPKNNVAYQAYFEYDVPKSKHRLMKTFPQSAKVYRTLFG